MLMVMASRQAALEELETVAVRLAAVESQRDTGVVEGGGGQLRLGGDRPGVGSVGSGSAPAVPVGCVTSPLTGQTRREPPLPV